MQEAGSSPSAITLTYQAARYSVGQLLFSVHAFESSVGHNFDGDRTTLVDNNWPRKPGAPLTPSSRRDRDRLRLDGGDWPTLASRCAQWKRELHWSRRPNPLALQGGWPYLRVSYPAGKCSSGVDIRMSSLDTPANRAINRRLRAS